MSEQDRNTERGYNGERNGENEAVREQEERFEDAAAWALEMEEERPRAGHAGILKKPEKVRQTLPWNFLLTPSYQSDFQEYEIGNPCCLESLS